VPTRTCGSEPSRRSRRCAPPTVVPPPSARFSEECHFRRADSERGELTDAKSTRGASSHRCRSPRHVWPGGPDRLFSLHSESITETSLSSASAPVPAGVARSQVITFLSPARPFVNFPKGRPRSRSILKRILSFHGEIEPFFFIIRTTTPPFSPSEHTAPRGTGSFVVPHLRKGVELPITDTGLPRVCPTFTKVILERGRGFVFLCLQHRLRLGSPLERPAEETRSSEKERTLSRPPGVVPRSDQSRRVVLVSQPVWALPRSLSLLGGSES
jgi:hypothetical protein